MVKRTDYTNDPREILSGVRNDEGNVVGVMVHGALDENISLVENILKFLDCNENDILSIKNNNKKLLNQIKREVGIETGVKVEENISNNSYKDSYPRIIMMASTGSDSGKTFHYNGFGGYSKKEGLQSRCS